MRRADASRGYATTHRGHLIVPLAVAVLALGCAAPSQLRRPAQDFYDATGKLSDAEKQVLSDVNTSIARSYAHRAQADFVAGKSVDVTARPPTVPEAAVDVRVKAVEAVQLYAQKLLALTGGNESGAVDEYSEGTAKSVSKLLPNSVPAAALAGVTAAFSGIVDIIIDRERYRTAVAAAKEAQPHLKTLAALIKNDDEYVLAPLTTAATIDGAAMNQILEHIRADKQVPTDRRLAAFVSVTSTNPVTDLSSEQSAVDSLMEAVLGANAALANGDQRTFGVVARNALDRAKAMYAVFQAVRKQD